jgi:pimeloyl-ACP methyl ester carboxylesterase
MIPSGKINKAFTKLPKEVLCTNIKYRHASRESVAVELRSNKRTRGWSERSMDIFVQRGVVEDDEGGFRLVAHPRLEWALYYDKETPAQCYDRLTDINIPFHAIMPTRPFAVPPKQLEADVEKMSQLTKITWIANATHQLPFERPDECMRAAALWLQDILHKGSQKAHL